METHLLRPGDPAWHETVRDAPHDFYHEPAVVEAAAAEEGGDACAVLVREGDASLLLPLVLRRLDGTVADGVGARDATSPYGYAGPIVAGDAPPEFVGLALAAAIAMLRDLAVVSLFVRLHPLIELPLDQLAPLGRLVTHGQTVSIDLTKPHETTIAEMRRDHRRDILRCRREPYDVRIVEDDSVDDEFVTIYHETMRGYGASKSYFFSRAYFRGLRKAVPDRLHVCTVRRDGVLACALLFIETNGVVQNHLSGTDPIAGRAGANKLMIDVIAQYARSRGNGVLHLGGGRGSEDDSLFDFKSGFSSRRHRFRSLRVEVEPAAFASAVARWEAAAGRSAADLAYFPPYRAPLPAPIPEVFQ